MKPRGSPHIRVESVRSFHEDTRRPFGESSQGISSEKNLINTQHEWNRRNTSPTYGSQTNFPSTTVLSGNTHKLRREETLTKKKIAWEKIDTIKQDMYRQHLRNRIDSLFYGKNPASEFRLKSKKISPGSVETTQKSKLAFRAELSDIGEKRFGEFQYWLIKAKRVDSVAAGGHCKTKTEAWEKPLLTTVVIQRRLNTETVAGSAMGSNTGLNRLRKKFCGLVRTKFGEQDLPHLLCEGPTNRT